MKQLLQSSAFSHHSAPLVFPSQLLPPSTAAQYILAKGVHAFIPPNFATGDQRGPCPGLNALADHGYIPCNVVATIQQLTDGTCKGEPELCHH